MNKNLDKPVNLCPQSSRQQNLILRAYALQAIRSFFIERGYLEVETPHRIPAPAPEAHIDAQASGKWFLHTSPELCMKRLLAAGYSRVFQICRCFRQGERGHRHLPEFTLLEWYCADITYTEMMEQCEELIQHVAQKTGVENSIHFLGHLIDLTKPWLRMTVKEAFEVYAPISMEDALLNDRFDEMIACDIEPHLGCHQPLFLYDYPAASGALAQLKPENPSLAQRFELYMGGMELCNAFTELTDAHEQRQRFETEQRRRQRFGKIQYPMPEMFLDALPFMPKAAGNALGIDRLIMLLANTARIDNVVAFAPEEL